MPVADNRGETVDAVTAMKIRIPRPLNNAIDRPGLLATLDRAAGAEPGPSAVALVTGAAGSGKTTLLAQWAARCADDAVAWVTVDDADGEITLWKAILAAVQKADIRSDPDRLRGLVVPKDGVDSGFVAEFVRLASAAVRPLWIVLDEVEHLIDEAAVRSVDLLLKWSGEPVRIAMAGRCEPPLALHRLRLDGRLVEIREHDLAFSAEHAALVLEDHGIHLDASSVETLVRRTEGWAAGLRLAAISLEGASDPVGRIAEFAGAERAVADYLIGEIFAGRSEDVLDFLLRTCVCDEICPDLARAVSGREDAGAVLASLARHNALTVELGGSAGWFRYHTLMLSYLRAELSRRSPSLRQELHRTVAMWWRDHGEAVRALDHAVAAEDPDLVAQLARTHGLGVVLAGRAVELERLATSLPEGFPVDPWFTLVAASACLSRGMTEEADAWLHRVRDHRPDPATGRLRAVVALGRARLGGDYRSEFAAVTSATADRSGHSDLDLLTFVERGVSALWLDRLDDAEADLVEATTLAEAAGHDHVVLRCLIMRAAVSAARGELPAMAERSTLALEFAATRGWAVTAPCAYAYALRGFAAYLALDDEQARRDGLLAVDLVGPGPEPTVRYSALALELATRFEIGTEPHAAAVDAGQVWTAFGTTPLSKALVAYAALPHFRMCVRVGETDLARAILRTARGRLGQSGEVSLLEASLLAHGGRTAKARKQVAGVLAGTTDCVVPTTMVACLLFDAVLAERESGRAAAHRSLTEALRAGESLGVLRPFQDGGDDVRRLITSGVGRFGRSEAFARLLCTSMRAGSHRTLEALTERERDVLTELPSLRTADEIAEDLFVSTSTVKTHMRSIYRKLGAPNRRSAVAEARKHGLL